MSVVLDLDAVCLICLQPSQEMQPIFTTQADGESLELQISDMISSLSELKAEQKNQTLPSKICRACLQDLKAAWRFRKNCQAAVTIFQTIFRLKNLQPQQEPVVTQITPPKQLAGQQIKIPKGLQIKRIKNDEIKQVHEAETLEENKTTEDGEEFLMKNKDTTSLYEELHDIVEAQDSETQEFQIIAEDLNETNEVVNEKDESNEGHIVEIEEDEDSDSTLVEFYLAEETTPSVQITNIDSNLTPITITKSNKISEKLVKEKQIKLIKTTDNEPQTRSGLRREALPRVLNKTPQDKQTKSLNKIVTDDSVTSAEEESNSKAKQPVPRKVKTRKRTSQSPETKLPKICELCGNSYRFQHALNAHMRRHYNERPFPCDFCDKAFISNVELRRHMRVHTGQKPYACQYCDRRFSDFGSRIKHERTHTGERPYHCVTCGKSFAYPHVLSVHVRTHTGEKRFPCPHCTKGFTKKAYLQSHIEQHHRAKDLQLIIDSSMDNSQNPSNTLKSDTFEEYIYNTEFINEDGSIVEADEYEDDDNSLMQPKTEGTESNHEREVEMEEDDADEYIIGVR